MIVVVSTTHAQAVLAMREAGIDRWKWAASAHDLRGVDVKNIILVEPPIMDAASYRYQVEILTMVRMIEQSQGELARVVRV